MTKEMKKALLVIGGALFIVGGLSFGVVRARNYFLEKEAAEQAERNAKNEAAVRAAKRWVD